MTKHIRFRPAAFATLALACAMAALTGCSKKVTQTDADYTTLEGRPTGAAELFVWNDPPITIETYSDGGTPGVPGDDLLIKTEQRFTKGGGATVGQIVDGTESSAFRMYNTAPNGGFLATSDYVLRPTLKLLGSHQEFYDFLDLIPRPSGTIFQARGILGGVESPGSPLTNRGTPLTPQSSTSYLSFSASLQPTDSLFTIAWAGFNVPAYARVWIDIYQFKPNATKQEIVASGAPTPVVTGNVDHWLIGYVDSGFDSSVEYDAEEERFHVLHWRRPLFGQQYLVRMTAVDSEGRVVAITRGTRRIFALTSDTYESVDIAAALVSPTRPQR